MSNRSPFQRYCRPDANKSVDQGQGAGQAIEDAATISVVLPRGTSPEAVSDRLKLYEKIRYDRAHQIQEYSRQAGKDWIDGKPQIDSKIEDLPLNNEYADEMIQ